MQRRDLRVDTWTDSHSQQTLTEEETDSRINGMLNSESTRSSIRLVNTCIRAIRPIRTIDRANQKQPIDTKSIPGKQPTGF